MRSQFNEQLGQLHSSLVSMGALCEDAISAAAEALAKGDAALAQGAYDAERELDRREREVEDICLKLLLRQQPVASDLRTVSAALKMISDLERIGDQAADIAELTRHITLPDGSIAALPYITETPMQNYLWINQAWLKSLGLSMPTTAQELVDVLTAFRDRDPNKNGP